MSYSLYITYVPEICHDINRFKGTLPLLHIVQNQTVIQYYCKLINVPLAIS